MKRNIAHKIRLYPNIEQSELIDKSIGCSRLMYNVMLSERKQVYCRRKEVKEIKGSVCTLPFNLRLCLFR